MRVVRVSVQLGLLVSLLLGCGGTAQPSSGMDSSTNSSFRDASADCAGCEYVLRGFEVPSRLLVGGEWLYAADRNLAQIRRIPLAGGTEELVSEGQVAVAFAVTPIALYFTAPDPIDSTYDGVWRIPHASGKRERVSRYLHEGSYLVGTDQEQPILAATGPNGATALHVVAADGTKSLVRQWPTAAQSPPVLSFIAILPTGELVWCDPVDGLWSAPSIIAEATHTATGWQTAVPTVTPEGLLLSNVRSRDPEGKSRVFLRAIDDPSGALTEVATSDTTIGSPRFFSGTGVVAVNPESGQLRLTRLDGTAISVLSPGIGPPEQAAIVAANGYLFFAGRVASGTWSVYRLPMPR